MFNEYNTEMQNGFIPEEAPRFAPIPEDTQVLVQIVEADWTDYKGEEMLNLRLCVMDGEYKNRNFFSKLKPFNSDAKKSERGKKLVTALDIATGGTMAVAYASCKVFTHPDTTLGLTNKMVNVVVGEWDMNGKSGNWIKGITPTGQPQPVAPTPKVSDNNIPF